MIDTVTVAGAPIDPCYVLAQVTVLHGRGGFGEQSQPSSATVVIEHPEGAMPGWQSGDTLTLDGPAGRMFAGRIAARTLSHLDDTGGRRGQFTVTCAGPLAALGVRKIGDAPWPQETGTTRATRILTAASTPWAVDGVEDLTVLPRDVDAQPALGLLDELTESTRAAVFDTPAGQVVYQALSGRARPVFAYRWQDFPPADTWSGFAPALTWDGSPPSIGQWPSPESEFPLPLPCDAVEWEPEWTASEVKVINHVRVGWGALDPQATVEVEDSPSITRHGRRYVYQGTRLATSTDANTFAAHILTTQSAERWELGEVVVALDRLDPATYTAAMGLLCGDHVTIQGLPQPAPASDWSGIVEGWAFTQWGQGGALMERLTLALSTPMLSLAVMAWQDYPALYRWDQHPGFVTWDDLDTLAAIGA